MDNKYPDWVIKHKKEKTAIHRIGNNYYLYEITSKWDPELKRAKKITKAYLGAITKDGLKKPDSGKYMPSTAIEYGSSAYLLNENQIVIEKLKKYFPEHYREIFILSALRFFYQCPLKNIKISYQDSWLSVDMAYARLSKDFLSHLLEVTGRRRENIVLFLKEFIGGAENLLVDLTHVFSQSDDMILAEKGYNSKLDFSPQINLLFIFSKDKKLPLFYRILLGNVRDVSSLKATIEEAGISDITIIADKGFYSEENITLLDKNNLKYIIPLKRNSSLIDLKILKEGNKDSFDGYFKYKDRYIFCYKCPGYMPVFVFLDDELKVKEQKDYLERIESCPEFGYSMQNFKQKQYTFGTISLLSNLEESPQKIFSYFKSRAAIEQAFDSFKNILDSDRTYMQNDYSMEGWMFINYLSLIYYYKVYHHLIEKDLLSRYSPLDVIFYLSKYRRVKIKDKWIDLEIPKQTRTLMEKLSIPIT